jgi:hypothetical protein
MDLGHLFVFVEDDQGWTTNYILIESPEPLTYQQLADWNGTFGGHRSFSVSVEDFLDRNEKLKEILRTHRIHTDKEANGPIPSAWKDYPLVVGGTGNY